MAQDFTDSRPAWSARVDEDVVIIEKNFAALKSSFSGSTAPASPVAGMWWTDTSTGILKVRNAGNTAWLSVWDLVNNKPVLSGLSGDITATMISSALKSPAANVEGLRKLGTGATDACAGNDSRLGGVTDGSVTQPKLGYIAGDNLIISSDNESSSTASTYYVKLKEIIVVRSGTLRIRFDGKSGGGGIVHFRIYRNGTAVGTDRSTTSVDPTTWTEDIGNWTANDACQIYGMNEVGGQQPFTVSNFRIYSGYAQVEYVSFAGF